MSKRNEYSKKKKSINLAFKIEYKRINYRY